MRFFKIIILLVLIISIDDLKAQNSLNDIKAENSSLVNLVEHPLLSKYFSGYKFSLEANGYIVESKSNGKRIYIEGDPKLRDDIVGEFIHKARANQDTDKKNVFIIAVFLSKGKPFNSLNIELAREKIRSQVIGGRTFLNLELSIIGNEIVFNSKGKVVDFRGYCLE